MTKRYLILAKADVKPAGMTATEAAAFQKGIEYACKMLEVDLQVRDEPPCPCCGQKTTHFTLYETDAIRDA